MADNRILHFEVVDVLLPVLLEAGLVARAVFGRGCWDDPGNFRPKKLGALDDSDSLLARFVG